jgi:hypothetical protein
MATVLDLEEHRIKAISQKGVPVLACRCGCGLFVVEHGVGVVCVDCNTKVPEEVISAVKQRAPVAEIVAAFRKSLTQPS